MSAWEWQGIINPEKNGNGRNGKIVYLERILKIFATDRAIRRGRHVLTAVRREQVHLKRHVDVNVTAHFRLAHQALRVERHGIGIRARRRGGGGAAHFSAEVNGRANFRPDL